MDRLADIAAGSVFGQWTALHRVEPPDGTRAAYWECQCSCGAKRAIRATALRRGKALACRRCASKASGLERRGKPLRTPRPKTSDKHHPLHELWRSMVRRCHEPKTRSYKYYGERGVSVCRRWRGSFRGFLEDMGPRPSASHSLDRYPDKNGNYEPGNVRWATAVEQANNKTNNHMVSFNGRTVSLAQLSRELGLDEFVLFKRLDAGWPIEKAITRPMLSREEQWKLHVLDRMSAAQLQALRISVAAGVLSQRAAAEKYGLTRPMVARIIEHTDWSGEMPANASRPAASEE